MNDNYVFTRKQYDEVVCRRMDGLTSKAMLESNMDMGIFVK